MVIVDLDEDSNVGFEIPSAAMDAALDLLFGEQSEPALNWFSHEALVDVKCR
jgi:hypothetical protein